MNRLHAMQDADEIGTLQINVTSRLQNTPIENATITLSFSGEPDETLESLQTDESGQTQPVSLEMPPLAYSMDSAQ